MGDYSSLPDKELFDLVEKANLAERLENDPAWKMLKEAADRIVDRAITEFALRTNPNDTERIIELQVIIKKYKYGLFDEVRVLKNDAANAFEEAKDRGAIGDFFASVKAKIGV